MNRPNVAGAAVATLRPVGEKILWLTAIFGLQYDDTARPRDDSTLAGREAAGNNAEAELLNGPQRPEKANAQADIDALSDSFA